MEFQTISTEFIKPILPTPNHPKIHKLSLLDQIHVPGYYVPVVLFYSMNKKGTTLDDHSARSVRLKRSLAETLTHFYPLAGKTRDDFSTECDDNGAYYIKSKVSCSLLEYVNQPYLTLLNKFLPEEDGKVMLSPGSPVTMVKETTFSCGGFALGIFISHLVVDAGSLVSFLRGWAAAGHDSKEEIVLPNFDSVSNFPSSDMLAKDISCMSFISRFTKKGKSSRRRFVFNAQSLANLKANATNSGLKNPTRVELVSALLSKCIMASLRQNSSTCSQMFIFQAVNLRRRAVPPMQECAFGNHAWVAPPVCTEKEEELSGLVHKLREAVARLDREFIKSLQGDDRALKLYDTIKEADLASKLCPTENGVFSFTSWCNFGFYDIDFGWGKPLWVTNAAMHISGDYYMDIVFLMDTIERGIEATVVTGEEVMALLEANKQLRAYASIDPTPFAPANA